MLIRVVQMDVITTGHIRTLRMDNLNIQTIRIIGTTKLRMNQTYYISAICVREIIQIAEAAILTALY